MWQDSAFNQEVLMPTTAEKLWKTTQSLPEPMLAEILDFAEFLQSKHALTPPLHTAARLKDLSGGLEQSVAFRGDPLTIQGRMRNEWL
jgi:hypothetical protein